MVLAHYRQRLPHRAFGSERNRIADHPALETFDTVDFLHLPLNSEILVDDTNPSLTRHRNRHGGLSDRVHRRADDRDVEGNRTRQARTYVHLSW